MPIEQHLPTLREDFKHRQKLDLAIVVILSVAVYFIAAAHDVLETIVGVLERYESWELDELLCVLIFLAFALLIFTLRRLGEVRQLNRHLDESNRNLDRALSEVKQLKGLLPICASCKKIRDDTGYWQAIESYIQAHSDASFTHSICPECAKKLYPEFAEEEDIGV